MILEIKGNISRYYVETLCLIFFPGQTFGEDEKPGEGIPEMYVTVLEEDENVTAYVSIKLNDKVSEATETVSKETEITIATHSAVAVGRAVFAAGKVLLDHTPPWGILTGVRPAKVAVGLIQRGNGILKTKAILRDEYFLNPQKAALATAVAGSERKIIRRVGKNTCSIYISIPFCPSRCAYCSFVSYTTPRLLGMIDEYIETLIEDLSYTIKLIADRGMSIATVYIGGGTPTTLNEEQLERLLSFVASVIDVGSLREYTLEAGRPDTITDEKLAIAKKYGVTRISVNPQTLNDDILKDIGRHHTASDFFAAYERALNSGIRDINVDLIAGLPGDDFKSFSRTLDQVLALKPTNITVHTFCVKRAADLLRQNGDVYSLDGGDAGKSVSYAQLNTKFAGYKPYYMYRQKNTVGNLENVGFALEGHEGLYNIYMMEEVQTIFAVGAGAVTKLVDYDAASGKSRIKRIFKPKYPYEYLSNRGDADFTELEKAVNEFFLESGN